MANPAEVELAVRVRPRQVSNYLTDMQREEQSDGRI